MSTMAAALPPLPGDIRLMNASAALVAVLGATALVAALAVALARHPVFALRAVRIEGDVARNSLQAIRASAMPRLAGTFFTIDLAAAKAAFEAAPWVRRAIVRRVFPNRLVVVLEEHRAAALWGGDGGDQLVNTYGEVFQANPGDVEDDDLPQLQGPDGSAARMLALQAQLQRTLSPLGARLEALELSPRGSWRARLDSGAAIELGRAATDDDADALVERTRRFVATLPEVARRYQSTLVFADLRHRDGYALRLKGVGTTAAADKPARN
jgi:cell division protein FtsQ